MEGHWYLTEPRIDGDGRYIWGEIEADPLLEGQGTAGLMDQTPTNTFLLGHGHPLGLSTTVRYTEALLLAESWGPSALAAWRSGDDSAHDAAFWAIVDDTLQGFVEDEVTMGDPRAEALVGAAREQVLAFRSELDRDAGWTR